MKPKGNILLAPIRPRLTLTMRYLSGRTLGSLNNFYSSLFDNQKLQLEQADLHEDISLGIKTTVSTTQLHLLKGLLHKRGAPNEIRHLASKVVLSQSRNVFWESRILLVRIKMKLKEIKSLKYMWTRTSVRIRKLLQSDQVQRYEDIKKQELSRVWNEEKAKSRGKVSWFTRSPLLDSIQRILN